MRDPLNEQIRLQFGRVTLQTRVWARRRLSGRADFPLIALPDLMSLAPTETVDTRRKWNVELSGALTADSKGGVALLWTKPRSDQQDPT